MSTQYSKHIYWRYSHTSEGQVYFDSLTGKGKTNVAALIDFIAKNGPQKPWAIWGALQERKEYVDDRDSNRKKKKGLRKTKVGTYKCYKTLKRHLDGLVKNKVLERREGKYHFYSQVIELHNASYLHERHQSSSNLKPHRSLMRKQIRNTSFVKVHGTVLLFYNIDHQQAIETNRDISLALNIIDIGNALLERILSENQTKHYKRDYLVACLPEDNAPFSMASIINKPAHDAMLADYNNFTISIKQLLLKYDSMNNERNNIGEANTNT